MKGYLYAQGQINSKGFVEDPDDEAARVEEFAWGIHYCTDKLHVEVRTIGNYGEPERKEVKVIGICDGSCQKQLPDILIDLLRSVRALRWERQ